MNKLQPENVRELDLPSPKTVDAVINLDDFRKLVAGRAVILRTRTGGQVELLLDVGFANMLTAINEARALITEETTDDK